MMNAIIQRSAVQCSRTVAMIMARARARADQMIEQKARSAM